MIRGSRAGLGNGVLTRNRWHQGRGFEGVSHFAVEVGWMSGRVLAGDIGRRGGYDEVDGGRGGLTGAMGVGRGRGGGEIFFRMEGLRRGLAMAGQRRFASTGRDERYADLEGLEGDESTEGKDESMEAEGSLRPSVREGLLWSRRDNRTSEVQEVETVITMEPTKDLDEIVEEEGLFAVDSSKKHPWTSSLDEKVEEEGFLTVESSKSHPWSPKALESLKNEKLIDEGAFLEELEVEPEEEHPASQPMETLPEREVTTTSWTNPISGLASRATRRLSTNDLRTMMRKDQTPLPIGKNKYSNETEVERRDAKEFSETPIGINENSSRWKRLTVLDGSDIEETRDPIAADPAAKASENGTFFFSNWKKPVPGADEQKRLLGGIKEASSQDLIQDIFANLRLGKEKKKGKRSTLANIMKGLDGVSTRVTPTLADARENLVQEKSTIELSLDDAPKRVPKKNKKARAIPEGRDVKEQISSLWPTVDVEQHLPGSLQPSFQRATLTSEGSTMSFRAGGQQITITSRPEFVIKRKLEPSEFTVTAGHKTVAFALTRDGFGRWRTVDEEDEADALAVPDVTESEVDDLESRANLMPEADTQPTASQATPEKPIRDRDDKVRIEENAQLAASRAPSEKPTRDRKDEIRVEESAQLAASQALQEKPVIDKEDEVGAEPEIPRFYIGLTIDASSAPKLTEVIEHPGPSRYYEFRSGQQQRNWRHQFLFSRIPLTHFDTTTKVLERMTTTLHSIPLEVCKPQFVDSLDGVRGGKIAFCFNHADVKDVTSHLVRELEDGFQTDGLPSRRAYGFKHLRSPKNQPRCLTQLVLRTTPRYLSRLILRTTPRTVFDFNPEIHGKLDEKAGGQEALQSAILEEEAHMEKLTEELKSRMSRGDFADEELRVSGFWILKPSVSPEYIEFPFLGHIAEFDEASPSPVSDLDPKAKLGLDISKPDNAVPALNEAKQREVSDAKLAEAKKAKQMKVSRKVEAARRERLDRESEAAGSGGEEVRGAKGEAGERKGEGVQRSRNKTKGGTKLNSRQRRNRNAWEARNVVQAVDGKQIILEEKDPELDDRGKEGKLDRADTDTMVDGAKNNTDRNPFIVGLDWR